MMKEVIKIDKNTYTIDTDLVDCLKELAEATCIQENIKPKCIHYLNSEDVVLFVDEFIAPKLDKNSFYIDKKFLDSVLKDWDIEIEYTEDLVVRPRIIFSRLI